MGREACDPGMPAKKKIRRVFAGDDCGVIPGRCQSSLLRVRNPRLSLCLFDTQFGFLLDVTLLFNHWKYRRLRGFSVPFAVQRRDSEG